MTFTMKHDPTHVQCTICRGSGMNGTVDVEWTVPKSYSELGANEKVFDKKLWARICKECVHRMLYEMEKGWGE